MPSIRALSLASFAFPACIAALLAGVPAMVARAEVHRCSTPDGGSVYTDKRCSDIGAIDRLPRAQAGPAGASRLYRSSCSRSNRSLI